MYLCVSRWGECWPTEHPPRARNRILGFLCSSPGPTWYIRQCVTLVIETILNLILMIGSMGRNNLHYLDCSICSDFETVWKSLSQCSMGSMDLFLYLGRLYGSTLVIRFYSTLVILFCSTLVTLFLNWLVFC